MSGATSLARFSHCAVVLEVVVGVNPALHADLGRPEVDGLANPLGELAGIDLVGVRGPLRLAEAAEGAANSADVGEVDVAVDDERRDVAGQLGAEFVGAGANLLDRLRAGLAEQRDQLVARELVPVAGPLDRPRRQVAAARYRGRGGTVAAPVDSRHPHPRHESREASGEHPEHRRIHPLPVHVLRVYAEALGQRVSERPQPLADLQRARERVLGRDVVAVGREPAEVGRTGIDEVDPPIREVRRDLDTDVRHQPAALCHQPPHVVEGHGRGPGREVQVVAAGGRVALGPASLRRLLGDVRDLGPVVPRMGDEVLEDHLLDVAMLLVNGRQRLERADPLLLGLADPNQDPAGEGNAQLAGRFDGPQPHRRMFRRRAGVNGLHEAVADRFEHQALRRGDGSQPCEVLTIGDADVGVREHPPLQGLRARPLDVGGEVLVPPGPQPLGHDRVDLRPLARQHEQLLDVASGGLVEAVDHLLGRVDVRLVGGERAVLAIAAAGPRERERQVSGIGDAPHRLHANETGRPARCGAPRSERICDSAATWRAVRVPWKGRWPSRAPRRSRRR